MANARTRLGDLQLAIMRVLWGQGELTVAGVHDALREDRGLALTTIATMLRKMEQKGVVTHRTDGRVFVYQPTVAESDVHRTMVGELTDLLFAGDAAALVSHLINEQQMDPEDLQRLKDLIAHREADHHRGGEANG